MLATMGPPAGLRQPLLSPKIRGSGGGEVRSWGVGEVGSGEWGVAEFGVAKLGRGLVSRGEGQRGGTGVSGARSESRRFRDTVESRDLGVSGTERSVAWNRGTHTLLHYCSGTWNRGRRGIEGHTHYCTLLVQWNLRQPRRSGIDRQWWNRDGTREFGDTGISARDTPP